MPELTIAALAKGRDRAAAIAARQNSLTSGLGFWRANDGSPRNFFNDMAKVTARIARRSCLGQRDRAAHSSLPAPWRARFISLSDIFSSPGLPRLCTSLAPQIWQSNAQARLQCRSEWPSREHCGQCWNGIWAVSKASRGVIAGKVKDRTMSKSIRAASEIFSAAAASMLKSKAAPCLVSISICARSSVRSQ